MFNLNLKPLLIGLFMLAAAGLSYALMPHSRIADMAPKINLETMIPQQFGDWKVDETIVPLMVSPDVKANLERIYSQILTRTYVNTHTGERVMLSIAYGKDQRRGMAVHYPEVCYPAQGFEIKSNQLGAVSTVHGTIPVRHLESVQGNQRYEPVTYWTTIGEYVSLGGLEKRLIELRYGLEGVIPDGLLFRVSAIDRDTDKSFKDQENFIRELMQSLPPEQQSRLAGIPSHLMRVKGQAENGQ